VTIIGVVALQTPPSAVSRPLTVLAVATYEKGQEFLRECKRQGCRVLLITTEALKTADWPRESIDETFYLPAAASPQDLVKGVSWLARTEPIDRIVPLDDFDVETAALLREHLRVPGMGDSTARYFRDKLAMRVKARDHGIPVPPFVHVLHHESLRRYMDEVPGPWVLKPRSQASAVGIRKITRPEQLWQALEALGDEQSFYLLEQYIPGDVFHVDAIVWERQVVFAVSHQYGQPPFDVAHQGGIFMTRRVPRDAPVRAELEALTRRLLQTLGFVRGVTHSEFIRGSDDGRLYFLETAARVGGAHIAETVEAATGVNLWTEWARVEIAGEEGTYAVHPVRDRYAGIVLSLARQEWPDTSAFDDPEVYFRVRKPHHIGFVIASEAYERVDALLEEYSRRIAADHLAFAPAPDRPSS
jgi:biotin carboxylase